MTATKSKVPGWLLPVALGAVITILVTIALTRGPASLDPDTPEGTVQEYLLAISEERWDDAVAIVHDDWRGSCQGFDLRPFAPGAFSAELRTTDGFGGIPVREDFAVIGEPGSPEPTIPADATSVEVIIDRHDDGGLGGTSREFVAFEVIFDGDFWWIVGDPWPYFIFSCPGR